MKKFALLPFAAMAVMAACDDSSKGLLAPEAPTDGPVLDIIGSTGGSLNATTNTMNLTAGGTAGTTTLFVDPTNGDGKEGCNLTGKTTLVVDVVSSSTAVTVSPSRITFDSCGSVPTLSVSPVAQGSADITLRQVSNNTGGSFNLSDAAFTVSVAAAASTTPRDVSAPVITPTIVGNLGSNGWYTSNVAVSWSVVDGESAVSNETNCGPVTISQDTNGQTITCSATSDGGTATQSVTIKRDATAPVINPGDIINTTWRNSDLAQAFTAVDNLSGLAVAADANFILTASSESGSASAPTTASKTVRDNAGNSTTRTLSALIDLTNPTISGAASTTSWTNQPVAVTFTCADALSRVASCGPNATKSTEGANQSVSGTAADNAGNTASTTVSGINIDLTAPTLSVDGGPADGASYYFGNVPAAPTCSARDDLSGLNGTCSVSGYGNTVGQHTVTATAIDNAGNQSTTRRSYTVLAWTLTGFYQPVDMGGALNVVKSGSTVPLKFDVFAGAVNQNEQTTTAAVKSFTTALVSCPSSTTTDEIEITSTGGTSLRYDATAGQFVQNWATPSGQAGKCYRATMMTVDGSTIIAFFKLK